VPPDDHGAPGANLSRVFDFRLPHR
jgi:hypothetical protein